jgi:hypothetical protein
VLQDGKVRNEFGYHDRCHFRFSFWLASMNWECRQREISSPMSYLGGDGHKDTEYGPTGG